MNPPHLIADVTRVLEGCKGTVVVVCPPDVVRMVAKTRIMQLFPKKRAVMHEDIKPGNKEIPGDVVVFVVGGIPEDLMRRLRKLPSKPCSFSFHYSTIVKYWEILNP